MLIVVEKNLSRDDAVRDSFRPLHKSSPASWQIGPPFVRKRPDSRRIEQDQVGILAEGYASLVRHSHEVRRLRSQSTYGLRETHGLSSVNPLMEQVGRHSGITKLVDMRTGVRQAN